MSLGWSWQAPMKRTAGPSAVETRSNPWPNAQSIPVDPRSTWTRRYSSAEGGAISFDLSIAARGYRPIAAGLSLLPLTLIMFLLSRRMGALADRIGPHLLMGIGPVIAASIHEFFALERNRQVIDRLRTARVNFAGPAAPSLPQVLANFGTVKSGQPVQFDFTLGLFPYITLGRGFPYQELLGQIAEWERGSYDQQKADKANSMREWVKAQAKKNGEPIAS